MGKEPELKLSDFSFIQKTARHLLKAIKTTNSDEGKLTSLKELEYSELVNALKKDLW